MSEQKPLTLNALGRAQAIYCIGDSHCLPLGNLLLEEDDQGARYLVHSKFMTGFAAQGFVDQSGRLRDQVITTLEQVGLLEDGKAAWSRDDVQTINRMVAAGEPMHPPLLLVFCGDIDLRAIILKQFGESFDFAIPGLEELPLNEACQIAPYSHVDDLLRRTLRPIIDGMVCLKSLELTRSFLAMLPPPSCNDDEFERLHKYRCPLTLRKKMVLTLNRVLGEMAKEAGIEFLDISDEVSKDWQLDPEYYLDGVHMGPDACVKLLTGLLNKALDQSNGHFNKVLYEKTTSQADAPDVRFTEAHTEARCHFQHAGIAVFSLEAGWAEQIKSSLDFNVTVGNCHRRPDWCGNPLAPFSDLMKSAELNNEQLETIYRQLYDEHVRGYFQACLGHDVMFINCRAIHSLPHSDTPVGPQTFHHDGCPPGIYRTISYLTNVDEDSGPFEYLDKYGNSQFVIGPAGTTFVFDANKIMHRGLPPRRWERRVLDFCVMLRPKRMPRRVFWAGMNNWPNDPFNFSVHGFRASPPFASDRITLHPVDA